ncbi:MAG: DEAD/DEAH box helicase, partial [Candidatus Thermoplasmatota archaeon]|nr:DEAD/DEAH box helicase [Candidatus Thermoplasmatota archaeon]
ALPIALSGKNLVLAVPTASGKSLVAYLAMLKSVLEKGGKCIYVVPLRALASEKYDDLKKFESLGIRVTYSIGDLDAADVRLGDYDIIVCTSEKADSLLRHKTDWLKKISVVVADEVHLINDGDRGPTLEVTLARFRQINKEAQIIALSATINNSQDIAIWLDAKHVKSEWRPVPLKCGVYLDGEISYPNNGSRQIVGKGTDDIAKLVLDTIQRGYQAMVFLGTRASAEKCAEDLADYLGKNANLQECAELAEEIDEKQDEPTRTGDRLAGCVKKGTAFHHAGLSNEQRKFIEENFKCGKLKCITATPTLAAGVNLPSHTVIIRDLYRYDPNLGRTPVPVLEIQQMMGRAGRPRYDKEGEAILISKTEREADAVKEFYINGSPENIFSKLGSESALRTHILSSVATRYVKSREELKEFMNHTFYAMHSSLWGIETTIDKVIETLTENEMISEKEGKFHPTLFGERVSDLYIDPLSAIYMRNAIAAAKPDSGAFGLLHAACAAPDMMKLYLRKSDAWIEDIMLNAKFLLPVPDDGTVEYEWFTAEVKTASLIWDWINGEKEESIEDKYSVGPGDIRNKVEIAQWLLYSMGELARIFKPEMVAPIAKITKRVKYGVKDELLPLIDIDGVGRIRAMKLYSAGFKTPEEIAKADLLQLSNIIGIGPVLARKIKNQTRLESEKFRF